MTIKVSEFLICVGIALINLTLYLFHRYLYIGNVQVMKTEFIAAVSRVGVALIRSTRGEYLCCPCCCSFVVSFLRIRTIIYKNMILMRKFNKRDILSL